MARQSSCRSYTCLVDRDRPTAFARLLGRLRRPRSGPPLPPSPSSFRSSNDSADSLLYHKSISLNGEKVPYSPGFFRLNGLPHSGALLVVSRSDSGGSCRGSQSMLSIGLRG